MGLAYNEYMSEAVAVVAQLAPASQSAGSVTIANTNMAGIARLLLILQAATLSGGSTVSIQAKQSTTSGGSYTNLGSAVTVPSGTNPIVELEIRAESLGTGGPFVEFVITVATASATISAVVLAATSAYDPASDNNLAAVQAAVVV